MKDEKNGWKEVGKIRVENDERKSMSQRGGMTKRLHSQRWKQQAKV